MRKKINFWLSVIFILVMLAIYISFVVFGDVFPVAKMQYVGIILCLLFSLVIFKDRKDTWLVRLALLFTAISDWFLVIKQNHYFLAMIAFTIVQLMYAVRLWENDQGIHRNRTHIFFRLILIMIMELGFIILFSKLHFRFERLVFIAVIYFSLHLMNVFLAFIQIRNNILFPIGMTLFFCCDVLVGLANVQNYITLSESSFLLDIINFPIDLIWVFYFPSQVLLVLSILSNNSNYKPSNTD